jgi:hypothetical protein
MSRAVRPKADTTSTITVAVTAACLLSLLIGLLFLFVRAPHPWGWNGFDHYHELALALASGQPFPTMDVPWGYAYFLAFFYRVFGDRPWIPLLVQVALNATMPLLLFHVARRWTDERTAAVAALILGVFSFNTVYASTQSSDAICTVLFLVSILVFLRAVEEDKRVWFALAGLATGVMSQFRPNLLLIPAVLAAYTIWKRRTKRGVVHGLVLLACATATLAPWVVRNYRLTRTIIPTSVHGGVQLWYGTLQVGQYLDSRAYNPRSVFEGPAFEYTSLDGVPILIRGGVSTCVLERHGTLSLFYWTDFDPVKRRVAPASLDQQTGRFVFDLPPPDADNAVYYYYFETAWPIDSSRTEPNDSLRASLAVVDTPAQGAVAPYVYFVSQDHLGDMDRYDDLLDVFDVIRLTRHEAWGEPLRAAGALERARVATTAAAVDALLGPTTTRVERDDRTARIAIGGDSTIEIPRDWHGRLTDATIAGPHAEALMYAHRSLAGLSHPAPEISRDDARCAVVGEVTVNDEFYRAQPQAMRRYSALAVDNIRRQPIAFLKASLYRMYRVFVVVGSRDKWTNQQFAGGAFVYGAAQAASLALLALFAAGVAVLWLHGADILLPLILIAYVPATIAPLLTNMRYSVTVQPLMFVFVAAALTAIRDLADRKTTPRP